MEVQNVDNELEVVQTCIEKHKNIVRKDLQKLHLTPSQLEQHVERISKSSEFQLAVLAEVNREVQND